MVFFATLTLLQVLEISIPDLFKFKINFRVMLFKNTQIEIYRTLILPIVLYGCETWSVTFREEHRLRVLENWLLRRTFGPQRDEVTGEWRRPHKLELCDM